MLVLDLAEHEKPRAGLNARSKWKPVQSIGHEGGDRKVARDTGNESGC